MGVDLQAPRHAGRGEPSRHVTVVWLSLALLIVTTAVYLPVRHFDFVNYDDPQYIQENTTLQAGLSLDMFLWACRTVQVANWHPLTILSYVLDYQLFGLNPGPYHLVNVGFHVLNTLLLFWLFARLTGRIWPSAWVAALFALHPLHVESVAWISERKDMLSTFFWLLTLWAYHAYARQPRGCRYAALLAAYVAALLSKATVVTLPFVLLLLDVWPLRRLAWGSTETPLSPTVPVSPTTLVVEKVPLFLLSGIITVLAYMAQVQAGAVNSLQARPFSDRLAHVTLAYADYLWAMLWPIDLAVYYPYEPVVPVWHLLAAGAVLLVTSAGVLWGARRYPYLLTGWLWYLGILVPVIGFVPGGGFSRADRFTYLPLVGVFIMAAWGFPDLLRGWRHRRVACAAAAVAALAACVALTVRQLSFWRNTTSLFEHALAITHDNLLAHSVIGTLEMDDGRRDTALHNLSEAARICDTSRSEKKICTLAHYNTGFLLAKRGDLDDAQQHYRAALRFDPSYAKAYLGLGLTLAARGDLTAAAASYTDALRWDPTLASAHNNLAIVLESMGQADAAIVHYAEGVRLEPQDAAARCNLGAALAAAGQLPAAIQQFRAAMQLKPQLVEAHLGLAIAYAQSGQAQAAIAELDNLLGAHAGATAVEVTLAWLLATAEAPELRNGARAVQLAEAAAGRTGHQDPEALNSLAAAYAEVGRFGEAVQTGEAALQLARGKGQKALADAVTQRLALYRSGQPVRDRPGAR